MGKQLNQKKIARHIIRPDILTINQVLHFGKGRFISSRNVRFIKKINEVSFCRVVKGKHEIGYLIFQGDELPDIVKSNGGENSSIHLLHNGTWFTSCKETSLKVMSLMRKNYSESLTEVINALNQKEEKELIGAVQ